MSKTIAKTTWEVVTTFSWGNQVKSSYPTRSQARSGLKYAKTSYVNGKPPSYIESVEMFRVKTITDIVGTGEAVAFYKKAR
ncbi:hypothetical protein PQC34_gp064 [Cronobacter phage A24]|uniref:Uncharacterized protein n=1 Tax=Cronobacter phage A24 TaxID=2795745 RepID=A0A7T5QXR8_9CAUD|nr:hypothetical protein PQC34_gp064 [Cronobacter phage A24]QQG33670.1 hypothetical protein [Cronobacter phage A24]